MTLPLGEQIPPSDVRCWTGPTGIDIAFEWASGDCAEGAGAPVVLLHGLNSCRSVWSEQFAALRSRHPVLSLDMRGHGQSGRPERGYDIADYAGDVIALLDYLALSPVHLVGASVGGMVAQSVAIIRPALLCSLTLVGTAGEMAPIDANGLAAAIEQHGPEAVMGPFVAENTFACGANPKLAEIVMGIIRREPAWLSAQRWREIASIRPLPSNEIRLPTLIVHGDRDLTVPTQQGLSLWKAIDGARLAVLPHCGHMPFLEYPFLFNKIVSSFFKDVECRRN